MHEDEPLSDLPEALPLRCVSPYWRILAVGGGLLALGLLFVVLMLGIALLHQGSSLVATVPPVPPRMPMAATPLVGAGEEEGNDNQVYPYPMKEELGSPPTLDDAASLRKRFLAKSQEVWKNAQGFYPSKVIASPDGESIAFVAGENLAAGPVDGIELISASQFNMGAMGGMPGGVGNFPPGVAGAAANGNEPPLPLLGVPAWSSDSGRVYIAAGNGGLRRYDVTVPSVEGIPFQGSAVTPVPMEPTQLIFVRSRPAPKVDIGGAQAAIDPTEVVLADLATRMIRVLVPASSASWSDLSVSPDGKRLALVSDHGQEGKRPRRLRVFVMDLAGGEPQPLTPSAAQVGPVCWTIDGQALVYARSQDFLPADAWEDDPSRLNGSLDLFLWDLTTNQETRLSRGGSCYSPSMAQDDSLFFLTWEPDRGGRNVRLRRMPLAAARAFAAEAPDPPSQDAAAWTELVAAVLETAKVPADIEAGSLTPEVLARLADTFDKVHQERFQQKPPQTPRQFERQWQGLHRLALPYPVRIRLDLVLGAFVGKVLQRQQGARWHLTAGLLQQPGQSVENESPFGYVVNPFLLAWIPSPTEQRSADEAGPLWAVLRRAGGRPIVLANDPAAGQAVVTGLVDPDLTRGMELLKQDLDEAGEEVLLRMLQQERHANNDALALAVGKLLYEHGRIQTLRTLMKQRCEHPPYDARKFNMLGLAYSKSDGQAAAPEPNLLLAVEAFKNALRCDLSFGPAYLNLAQAYEQSEDIDSARQCLRRYLQLFPDGPHAADAQRRLATPFGSLTRRSWPQGAARAMLDSCKPFEGG